MSTPRSISKKVSPSSTIASPAEAQMTELDVVVAIESADDIVTARQAGRNLATKLDFSMTDVTMITTAISEVARNISKYAGRGEIRLGVIRRQARRALMVEAVDQGPGIADPE